MDLSNLPNDARYFVGVDVRTPLDQDVGTPKEITADVFDMDFAELADFRSTLREWGIEEEPTWLLYSLWC